MRPRLIFGVVRNNNKAILNKTATQEYNLLKGEQMRNIILIITILLAGSTVLAGNKDQKENTPVFSDQDLDKYGKPQNSNSPEQRQLPAQHEYKDKSNDIDKSNISYEATISKCGLSRQRATLKLATYMYFTESEAIFVNDKTLREACARMNKEGEKCYMAKPLPIIETKYVFGDFCRIMIEGGAEFTMEGYSVKLSHHETRDGKQHQIIVQFEKFNETTLLVRRITYDDGRTFDDQMAGFMLLWFFNPSAI